MKLKETINLSCLICKKENHYRATTIKIKLSLQVEFRFEILSNHRVKLGLAIWKIIIINSMKRIILKISRLIDLVLKIIYQIIIKRTTIVKHFNLKRHKLIFLKMSKLMNTKDLWFHEINQFSLIPVMMVIINHLYLKNKNLKETPIRMILKKKIKMK
jgi:hypothetical protein